MSGVNKVILLGNLGSDPEVRTLESGTKVANFNIATNEFYKDRSGERQKRTEWHRLSLWDRLAEIAEEYLKKGNQVYVEGRLRTRQWEDKEGNNRSTTEIRVDNMVMLSGKSMDAPQTSTQSSNESNMQESSSPAAEAEDDLPF